MRLKKLWIKSFKNLHDVTVQFKSEELVSVVIGRNGTGKSNLIEFLVIVFRDLDLGLPPSYTYKLTYSCEEKTDNINLMKLGEQANIEIDTDTNRSNKINVKINNEAISYSKFRSEKKFLPRHVFGYYSGPSNRLEDHFKKHQDDFYRKLLYPEKFNIKEDELPLRPLFYARPIHSQFVLLAFFLDKDENIKNILKEHLGIIDLESVLFVLNEPHWSGSAKNGDKRFWNAKGIVQKFLDKLIDRSMAPMTLSYKVPTNLPKPKNTSKEFKYLFIKDIETLRELRANYNSDSDFFKTLESTYISELIYKVKIRVKIENQDGSLTFRELSEGEQQLLMVLGLLRFTKEKESLFLLDEPDTHLNPNWSLDYLDLLKSVVGNDKSSHIILGTHDPLLIGELKKEQVQILRKVGDSHKVEAVMPFEDPRGMGYAGILISDMFGLKAPLDRYTLNLLEEKREIAIKENLTKKDKKRLSELNTELDKIDFTTAIRDPLYSEFVKAKSHWKKITKENKSLDNSILSDDEKSALFLFDQLMKKDSK